MREALFRKLFMIGLGALLPLALVWTPCERDEPDEAEEREGDLFETEEPEDDPPESENDATSLLCRSGIFEGSR